MSERETPVPIPGAVIASLLAGLFEKVNRRQGRNDAQVPTVYQLNALPSKSGSGETRVGRIL